jgi:Sulfotransferase domain
MRLPDFLIIGAQKCGTTWLADQLGRLPGVFMAPTEIHFFDKAENWGRIEWYARHFEFAGRDQLVGEKTPDYLWAMGEGAEGHLPDVHHNLHRTLPEARLIIVLRNPVERALSALTHLIRTRRVAPWHGVDELLVGRKHHLIRGHGLISKGFYFRQLAAYGTLFRKDQMLVLVFEEDVVNQPKVGLRRSCEFLSLPVSQPALLGGAEQNASRRSRLRLLADFCFPPGRPMSRLFDRVAPAWKPVPSDDTIAELYDTYAAENERLFQWLGRPMPAAWLRPPSSAATSSADVFTSRRVRLVERTGR